MPQQCPECGSDCTTTIRSHRCPNNTRKRRHECHVCQHRWSAWDGPRPPLRGSTARRGRPIAPWEVELMLTDRSLNHNRMAAKLELHKATVRNVRLGNILGHIHPELPRWTAGRRPTRTCHTCQHWAKKCCSFGFPEQIENGIRFAQECALYTN